MRPFLLAKVSWTILVFIAILSIFPITASAIPSDPTCIISPMQGYTGDIFSITVQATVPENMRVAYGLVYDDYNGIKMDPNYPIWYPLGIYSQSFGDTPLDSFTVSSGVPVTVKRQWGIQGDKHVSVTASEIEPWLESGIFRAKSSAVACPAVQIENRPTKEDIVFSDPGEHTWKVPAGVKKIRVKVWGAGGAGLDSDVPHGKGGGGGGGGGYAEDVINVNAGERYTVNVGKGGAGTYNYEGNDGGRSAFGGDIFGEGGQGGTVHDSLSSMGSPAGYYASSLGGRGSALGYNSITISGGSGKAGQPIRNSIEYSSPKGGDGGYGASGGMGGAGGSTECLRQKIYRGLPIGCEVYKNGIGESGQFPGGGGGGGYGAGGRGGIGEA